MRDEALPQHAALIHEGLARMKAAGAEVVLIDPQYATRVIAKPNVEEMVALIATAAKAPFVLLGVVTTAALAALLPARAQVGEPRSSTCRSRRSCRRTGCT